jgi:hypothetical protein
MPDQGMSLPKRPPKLQKMAASKIKMGPLICCFTIVIIAEKTAYKEQHLMMNPTKKTE